MTRLSIAPWLVLPPLLLSTTVVRADEPRTPECLAASEAAASAAKLHRLRDEHRQLLICAAPTCPAVVRTDCLSHVFESNARIPTIVFDTRLADASVTDVKVSMDGEVLAEKLAGVALAVDPGEHAFVFETPGQKPVTKRFVIEQAQKDRREVIFFGSPPPPAPVAKPGLGMQKTLAIVAAGVGLVGLGIGTAFGAVALGQKSDAKALCPGATCATQAGVDKWSTATTSATVSTIGLIIGAVGMGAGAVLWFTAPRSNSGPSAQVGVGPGFLTVAGTW